MTIGEQIRQDREKQNLEYRRNKLICMSAFESGMEKAAKNYKMTQQNVSKIIKKHGHTAFMSCHHKLIEGKNFVQKSKTFKSIYNYKA